MINQFKGPYGFTENIIRNWNSKIPGIYYVGIKTAQNQLAVYYIGKAVSEGGIRARLLEHLADNKWLDVTHFGYSTSAPLDIDAVERFEIKEIKKYSPKYNIVGLQ